VGANGRPKPSRASPPAGKVWSSLPFVCRFSDRRGGLACFQVIKIKAPGAARPGRGPRPPCAPYIVGCTRARIRPRSGLPIVDTKSSSQAWGTLLTHRHATACFAPQSRSASASPRVPVLGVRPPTCLRPRRPRPPAPLPSHRFPSRACSRPKTPDGYGRLFLLVRLGLRRRTVPQRARGARRRAPNHDIEKAPLSQRMLGDVRVPPKKPWAASELGW